MTSAVKSFGALLQTFFTDHLVAHRRVSPQTVSSYRDTFRLLLRFPLREDRRSALGTSHRGSQCHDDPLLLG